MTGTQPKSTHVALSELECVGSNLQSAPEVQYIARSVDVFSSLGLERFVPTPPLKDGSLREIWATPNFLHWFGKELEQITPDDPDDPTPIAQVYAKFHRFCEGRKMVYPHDIRNLRPVHKAVWELKTTDVRLFGWFPSRNCLILHSGADANFLHAASEEDRWLPYVDAIEQYILELDNPAIVPITGTETEHVLSNRTFS
ncbi:hypothetical protein [Gluconobacter sp. Dm-44]|uniref:hypothetical protein n=1 Tax=Gluconobacter sp. Dm-44 TaxID=2799805 RepID=UPI001B8CF536|nr:hypothetical protein [Gluconobacter sp. Dm-44]MBS1060739.1 hypothetical protein [Gluconobacter sp. Dm-44]